MIPANEHRVASRQHSNTVDVYLTIDTEFWPRRTYHHPDDYVPDFERDVLGRTSAGSFGLEYQLDLLTSHRLQAVFFVEPLCVHAVGEAPVKRTVDLIRAGKQEVQLHLHTEWLQWMPEPLLPTARGEHMHHFSLEDQTRLVEAGLAVLRNCGIEDVCAFRAGNYGANLDTLRALARNRILFDSSHNTNYLGSACDMESIGKVLQPMEACGVREFPITFFRDFRGRNRHLQLTANSIGELRNTLLDAWSRRWQSVVIVSHSFELIKGRNKRSRLARPDTIVIRRFRALCEFLDENRDKFRTSVFSEKPTTNVNADQDVTPLRVRRVDTCLRLVEQALRRIL